MLWLSTLYHACHCFSTAMRSKFTAPSVARINVEFRCICFGEMIWYKTETTKSQE